MPEVAIVDACQRRRRGGSPTAVLDDAALTDEERCRIPTESGTSHAVFRPSVVHPPVLHGHRRTARLRPGHPKQCRPDSIVRSGPGQPERRPRARTGGDRTRPRTARGRGRRGRLRGVERAAEAAAARPVARRTGRTRPGFHPVARRARRGEALIFRVSQRDDRTPRRQEPPRTRHHRPTTPTGPSSPSSTRRTRSPTPAWGTRAGRGCHRQQVIVGRGTGSSRGDECGDVARLPPGRLVCSVAGRRGVGQGRRPGEPVVEADHRGARPVGPGGE